MISKIKLDFNDYKKASKHIKFLLDNEYGPSYINSDKGRESLRDNTTKYLDFLLKQKRIAHIKKLIENQCYTDEVNEDINIIYNILKNEPDYFSKDLLFLNLITFGICLGKSIERGKRQKHE